MRKNVFYNNIKTAKIEKDVEYAFTTELNEYFPGIQIECPCMRDRLIDTKTKEERALKLIVEYKRDKQFANKVARMEVIAQRLKSI